MKLSVRTLAAAVAATLLLAGCAGDPDATPASADASGDPAIAAPVIDDSPLEDQMRLAINANDAALVEALVAAGADLTHDYGRGMSPLHLAVNAQDADVVEALVAGGADLEAPMAGGATFTGGDTPLLQAANFNNGAVVRVLVQGGADPTAVVPESIFGTAMHRAAQQDNYEVVATLLEEGVDVDLNPEGVGISPLVVAVFWGSTQSAEMLILAGADVTWTDEDGTTLLAMARANGFPEVAALLEAVGAPE